eukprot:COSAG06_NODE_1278_length_10031_cov_105.662002_5_plen_45_part_00
MQLEPTLTPSDFHQEAVEPTWLLGPHLLLGQEQQQQQPPSAPKL